MGKTAFRRSKMTLFSCFSSPHRGTPIFHHFSSPDRHGSILDHRRARIVVNRGSGSSQMVVSTSGLAKNGRFRGFLADPQTHGKDGIFDPENDPFFAFPESPPGNGHFRPRIDPRSTRIRLDPGWPHPVLCTRNIRAVRSTVSRFLDRVNMESYVKSMENGRFFYLHFFGKRVKIDILTYLLLLKGFNSTFNL